MKKGILVVAAAASLSTGAVLADEIGGLARAGGTALMEACRDMMSSGMMGREMMSAEGRRPVPNDQWRGAPAR